MMSEIENQLARFVHLADLERELKAKLADVTAERIALEGVLLDHWSNNGITQMRVAGLTVYPQTTLYASAPLDAVREAGLDDLVGVNSQSLSAFVREKRRLDEPLPEPLAAAIRITEKTSLRTRRGT